MKTLTNLAPQSKALALSNKEQDDLLISPYLSKEQLPTLLSDLLPLAKTPAQQDMLLLSVLTASGSAMTNTYFTYGPTRRKYYPNLICFIEAMAAQGKSIVGIGQQLLEKINQEEPLFLAGDSTHAAFVQHLAEQNGVGFCYESEGSVITDIWRRSGCNGYNSLLRKAAEHEEYRLSRKTEDDIVIAQPRLSMLITGTYDQFATLIPSASNGLFSRILPLVIRENAAYDRTMALTVLQEEETEKKEELIGKYAQQLLQLRQQLAATAQPIRFSLTMEQAGRLGEAFYNDSLALMPKLGPNFHQTLARMTVHTLRVAHILTVNRGIGESGNRRIGEAVIVCSEEDFQTAMLIGRKMLLHAADAYLQIDADRSEAIPAARGSFQQLTFLKQLPEEFSTAECQEKAGSFGVTSRSVERWLVQWVNEGTLVRVAHGYYRKVA